MFRAFQAIAIVLLMTSSTWSQQYSVTPYQGFGSTDSGFAITSPQAVDANIPGITDGSGMSPDSWSQSSSLAPPRPTNFVQSPVPASNQVLQNPVLHVPNQISPYPLQDNTITVNGPSVLKSDQVIANGSSGVTEPTKSPFRSASFATVPKGQESTGLAVSEVGGIVESGRTMPGVFSTQSQFGNGIVQGSPTTGSRYSVYPLYKNGSGASVVASPSPDVIVANPPMNSGMNFSGMRSIPAPPHLQNLPVPSQNSGVQFGVGSGMPHQGMPPMTGQYRPDLGQRSPHPTVRNFGSYDDGKKFDFEDKKKQYPPMSEIFATGRYFASAEMMYLKPHFQDNTAFTTNSSTFGESTPFDFDYEVAPFLRFGFESKYGPGIEFDYFQYDESSNVASFTATGGATAEISSSTMGSSRLAAVNPGDVLTASHSFDIETFGVSFFKEVQLPISRINGRFGFQYVSIAQTLDATLVEAGGTTTLQTRSDMRAYGPKFTLEYYRPVGHTKLEFITTVAGSVLFGRRDQFVENTQAAGFSRVGADEFITNVNFSSGVQYKHNIAEKRAVFARLGMVYSTWIGGGSANDPQGDFGLRGFSFGVGYNR